MLNFFHKESKTIIGAATIVGVLSFVSRLVGLIRDRVLAGTFGAGDVLDVYYAAFKIPDLLFSLVVVGALSASFIPIFVKIRKGRTNNQQAWLFTNNILHVLAAAMVVLVIIIFAFAEPLSALIAPGFPAFKQADVAVYMRIMILAQLLLTGSMVFGSVLQSLRRFFLYALAPIFYNFGIIFGAVFFTDWLGPIGLAWGVVFGALLHLIVQIIGIRNVGYRYSFSFTFKDPDTRELIRLTGPRLLGIATSQILFIILAVLASGLAPGSVTIFQFAYNIQFFAVGIVGISFAIAAFPLLSETAGKTDLKPFIETCSSTIRQILYLLVPMTILFLVLRAQIVRVVVGAGQFDWTATIATADTLAFFAMTMIPQAIVFVLVRAYFALHDTMTPLAAGVVAAIVGVVSAFLFTDSFGVIGLGMAFSLASIVNLIILWIPLRQRLGSLDEAHISASLLKISAAGLVCAVVMQALKPIAVSLLSLDTFLGVLSQGLFAGGAGLICYVLITYFLRTEELDLLLSAMKRRFLRKMNPEETISSQIN